MTSRHRIIGARMIILRAVDPEDSGTVHLRNVCPERLFTRTELTDLPLRMGAKCALCDVEDEDLCVALISADFTVLLCREIRLH